jgi:hypothetical protein
MPDIIYIASGRLGDFIYQLSVINENYINTGNKGLLYITSRPESFAHGLEKAFNDTKDYILTLPYISDYKIYNGEPYDINLSKWRSSALLFTTNWNNIFKDTYNINWGSHPWLFSDKNKDFEDKILINCNNTQRFPGNINYKKLLEPYDLSKVIFVSQNESDYLHFNKVTNITLKTYIPESITDYIRIVNSCKLFIGSLSSPLTYAYGLHKKNITLLSSTNTCDNIHVINLVTIPEIEIMI